MAGKNLWGVTVLGDRDRTVAEPLVGMLHRSANHLDMRWRGVLLGNGSKPGNVLRDDTAPAGARTFFGAAGNVPASPANAPRAASVA